MKIILTLFTISLLVISCDKDKQDSDETTRVNNARLLSRSQVDGATALVYFETTKSKGLRPVDDADYEELPSAFSHAILPTVETWANEIAVFDDGSIESMRSLLTHNAGSSGLESLAPPAVTSWSVNRAGSITGSNTEGEILLTDFAESQTSSAFVRSIVDYELIPRDSFIMALNMVAEELGDDDPTGLSVEMREDVAILSCNTPNGGVFKQGIDLETHTERFSILTDPLSGEVIKTFRKVTLDDLTGRPIPVREQTKKYLNPNRTDGTPMYSFENTVYSSFTFETFN